MRARLATSMALSRKTSPRPRSYTIATNTILSKPISPRPRSYTIGTKTILSNTASVNLHWTHEYLLLASVVSAFSIAGLQIYSVIFVLYEFGSGLLYLLN